MKKFAYLTLAIAAIALASCSKNMNSASPSSMSVETQKQIVVAGPWTVNRYVDRGIIHTSEYKGYTFLFNSDGTLVANSSDATYNGAWSLHKVSDSNLDDSNHHMISDDNKITITITGNSQMDQLNEEWTIIRLSDTEMALRDDNMLTGEEIRFTR